MPCGKDGNPPRVGAPGSVKGFPDIKFMGKDVHLNFEGAKTACEDEGGSLINLSDVIRRKAVYDAINKDFYCNMAQKKFWVDFKREDQSSTFKWSDDTAVDMTAIQWQKGGGKVNNSTHCGLIMQDSNADNKLNAVPCGSQGNYVCQI